MATTKSSKRYAKALFDLSVDNGRLDQVSTDVKALRALVLNSKELTHFLEDPLLTVERRSAILQSLFQGKIEPLVYQFILFVEEKNRIAFLADICEKFDELFYDYKGIIRVRIISAVELTSDQTEAISAKLREKFGKEIEPHGIVDPSILGGFRVVIGDQVFDHSLINQLNRVKQNIIAA